MSVVPAGGLHRAFKIKKRAGNVFVGNFRSWMRRLYYPKATNPYAGSLWAISVFMRKPQLPVLYNRLKALFPVSKISFPHPVPCEDMPFLHLLAPGILPARRSRHKSPFFNELSATS